MNALGPLRLFTFLEGLSYLVLLCIAMPLKYGFGLPIAVKLAGGLHGVLFLGFVMNLYQAQSELRWPKRRGLGLLVASLVPGSLVWMDRELRRLAQDQHVA